MASSQRTGSWRWDPVKTAHPNSLYISQSRCSRPDLTSVFWGPQSPKRSLTASRPAGRKRRLGDPDQGHLGQARTRRRAGARTESEGTGSDAGLMLGALGPPMSLYHSARSFFFSWSRSAHGQRFPRTLVPAQRHYQSRGYQSQQHVPAQSKIIFAVASKHQVETEAIADQTDARRAKPITTQVVSSGHQPTGLSFVRNLHAASSHTRPARAEIVNRVKLVRAASRSGLVYLCAGLHARQD